MAHGAAKMDEQRRRDERIEENELRCEKVGQVVEHGGLVAHSGKIRDARGRNFVSWLLGSVRATGTNSERLSTGWGGLTP